jgi:hypothetical protein
MLAQLRALIEGPTRGARLGLRHGGEHQYAYDEGYHSSWGEGSKGGICYATQNDKLRCIIILFI